jgi:hypothetical protein
MHVRFSSQEFFNSIERKAVTQQEFSATKILTAAFAVKQSFNSLQTRCY